MILDGVWELNCPSRNFNKIPINIPGDVFTSLIDSKIISDPYYSTNERLVQWVSEVEWVISRHFGISNLSNYSAYVLVLELVDSFSTIYINDNEVLKTTSTFIFYRTNVLKYLKEGSNTIRIVFHVAKKEASKRFFSTLPKSYPYSENNKVPFMNYIRSPQFHSGWDWGPCVIPSGIYKTIRLLPIQKNGYDLIEVSTEQIYEKDDEITLKVDVDIENYEDIENSIPIKVKFDSDETEINVGKNSIGKHRYSVQFSTKGKERWNTHDFGEPKLYDLTVSVLDQKLTKRIGIRKLVVDTHEDDYGTTFQFVLNGHVINAKGANFIPIDSIPSRMTYSKTRELISDMVLSNMNIVRVWGGGFYNDSLLEICDELGVLVWQDLMFGCAQYPNTEEFHSEVSKELECQIMRMKHHASLTLYCGDNEDFQAINWFSFTKDYKEWLKNEYVTFNQFLKTNCDKFDKSRIFWPSSPSDGTFNYNGEWTSEKRGDLHYWEVWHGGQPFESFYTIKPRFCSEFGYQSYPSLPTVKKFAPENEFNIFSDSFDNHQKNAAGNMLIKNMFSHYFHQPKTFVHQLYLSQVQQSIAIKMGCEYFRTLKPYTRGIIYWQINDCWPVTSWSSIEYEGRWKQLQYHAKHFFDPLLPTLFETKDYKSLINKSKASQDHPQKLKLFVVNDLLYNIDVSVDVVWLDFNGDVIKDWIGINRSLKSDSAEVVWEIDSSEFNDRRSDGFFRCVVTDKNNGVKKTNYFCPTEYKNCNLKLANIKVEVTNNENGGSLIHLSTDKPAFFVHLESEKVRKFSDSSFLLVPTESVVVSCDENISIDDLTIYQLAEVGY